MKRRDFLKFLGIGIATAIVAPKCLSDLKLPKGKTIIVSTPFNKEDFFYEKFKGGVQINGRAIPDCWAEGVLKLTPRQRIDPVKLILKPTRIKYIEES